MCIRAGPPPGEPNARVHHGDPLQVRTETHVFHGRFATARDLLRAGVQRADVSAHNKSSPRLYFDKDLRAEMEKRFDGRLVIFDVLL